MQTRAVPRDLPATHRALELLQLSFLHVSSGSGSENDWHKKKKSSPCTENSKDVLLSPWYTQRNCYGFLFLGQFWLVAGYELLPIIGFTC